MRCAAGWGSGRRALARVLLVAAPACARGPGIGPSEAMDRRGLLVRNRSAEVLCEAYVHPTGEAPDLDALGPAEVIAPGGSRYFPLPAGPHDVQLRDCNGALVMHREGMHMGPGGVMLSYEERN